MVTQMELSSTSGPDIFKSDNTPFMSNLDSFMENPMEQNELEYFKSQFESNSVAAGDTVNDFIQKEVLESLSSPPTPSEDSPPYHLSFYESSSNSSDFYGATSLIYDSDELKPFAKDFSSFNGLITLGSFEITNEAGLDAILDTKSFTTKTVDLEGGIKYEFDIKNELDSSGMYSPPSSNEGSPRSYNPFDCSSSDIPAALRLKPEEHEILSLIKPPPGIVYKDAPGCPGGNGKGKISVLQKRALDTVFSIIEQPSRGLVLNIAQELGLHHITVKNFFSNGRRRLRRAAARVQDPERTQRENQRRKEKRRLAAISAVVNNSDNNNTERFEVPSSSKVQCSVSSSSQTTITDNRSQKERPQISNHRKALMEKLASKVQRSVAQRSLQGDIPDLGHNNQYLVTNTSFPLGITSTQINLTPKIEFNPLTYGFTKTLNNNSETIDALAGSQLDFDINTLDVTPMDSTHLDLQAYLEVHPTSSLELHDPLGTSIDGPVSDVDIPMSAADIPVSDLDFAAIANLDLIQNTTTELLEVPQDPDPWAFF